MSEKLTVTEEQLETLRAQHGRVARVDTPAGHVVFRAPKAPEENMFQTMLFSDKGHAGQAWRTLMVTCVVSPDPKAFMAILESWPGLNLNKNVMNALRVLRGEVNEDEVK